jgi:2-oxoisovalerate dehydrogenase E2 component (dihydrolipoyl transacylase)
VTRVKQFNLPDLGEGLTEGEILKWLVSVGDTVELNQPIVEVETAKAAVEIPAKWAGQITEIYHPEGEVVEVGTPIVAIDTEPGAADPEPVAEGRTPVLVGYGPRTVAAKRRPRSSSISGGTSQPPASGAPSAPGSPAAPVAATAPGSRASSAPSASSPASSAPASASSALISPAPSSPASTSPASTSWASSAPAPSSPAAASPVPSSLVLAKPPVRKLARDLGVSLAEISGTGPSGSITRDDVLAVSSAPPVSSVAVSAPGERETRVPVKGVRKLTAENMVASAFTAPHVSEFLTIDMTRSMRALDRLRAQREWRDVRVSPLLMVAKAVLGALKRHPMVNSSWAGDEIVVKHDVNLGIAAATDRGLIVPNVKDAASLSLRQLADALNELVATAKQGRTAPADMAGGTFTITNVGVFGVDTGTPILPPGEAAILAFGAVREQPWVHKGKVKPRLVTTLGISFDHRIIDGELGSRFLRDVGDFLADPEATLLAWS